MGQGLVSSHVAAPVPEGFALTLDAIWRMRAMSSRVRRPRFIRNSRLANPVIRTVASC